MLKEKKALDEAMKKENTAEDDESGKYVLLFLFFLAWNTLVNSK